MLPRHVFRNVSGAMPYCAVAFRGGPARSFVAVATNHSRPPVNLFGLDGTYAMALVLLPTHWKHVLPHSLRSIGDVALWRTNAAASCVVKSSIC